MSERTNPPIAGVSLGVRYDNGPGDILRPGEVFFVRDGSGAAVELPLAASAPGALVYVLASTPPNVVKVNPQIPDTIDGAGDVILAAPERAMLFVSLGALNEWRRII